MPKYRYFSDQDGQTIQVERVFPMVNEKFAATFPDVKGLRFDSFSKCVGTIPLPPNENGEVKFRHVPITRCIAYKANPSKHACDSRCLNATGRTMTCECSCGGVNHGRGMPACEAVDDKWNGTND